MSNVVNSEITSRVIGAASAVGTDTFGSLQSSSDLVMGTPVAWLMTMVFQATAAGGDSSGRLPLDVTSTDEGLSLDDLIKLHES